MPNIVILINILILILSQWGVCKLGVYFTTTTLMLFVFLKWPTSSSWSSSWSWSWPSEVFVSMVFISPQHTHTFCVLQMSNIVRLSWSWSWLSEVVFVREVFISPQQHSCLLRSSNAQHRQTSSFLIWSCWSLWCKRERTPHPVKVSFCQHCGPYKVTSSYCKGKPSFTSVVKVN